MYLFMAVLGLCGCAGFSLVAASSGYSLVAVHGLLVAGAPRCRAQALGPVTLSSGGSQALEHRLSSCGARA